VRPVQLLGDLADDFGARRVGEAFELAQMLVEQLERPRPFGWRADQQRALDGLGDGNQFACDVRASTVVSCRRAR
jgi:hypothetical protein